MRKPDIGSAVHYRSYGTPTGEYEPACRAAIVTAVTDNETSYASVAVLNPTGLFFNEDCPYSDGVSNGGTWHWPSDHIEP